MLGYNILSDKIRNTHCINMLHIALKKTPLLWREGGRPHPKNRESCSLLLGLFFYLKDHVLLS